MANDAASKQGQKDAQAGKGPKQSTSFPSATVFNDYMTAYNKAKK